MGHITQAIDQVITLPRGPVVGTDAVSLSYLNNTIANIIPAGTIAYFATSYNNGVPTAPSGWLKANGALLPIANYQNLYNALVTSNGITPWFQANDNASLNFRIPDLRGVFIRGWNDGLTNVAAGNPDTNPPSGITDISSHDNIGRAFGSYQADDLKSHSHTVTDPGHTHKYSLPDSTGAGSGDAYASVYHADNPPYFRSTGSSTTGITIASTGGTETRPTNIALLACIKY